MITYEQAGELLGLAAARDQRTVGDADILAWHDDLNAASITYDDARAALTRFYVAQGDLRAEDRFRVTTPDVIHHARRLRRERLANFTYEPPNADADPHYLTRLRSQIAATVNGDTPAAATAPALEGEPHPTVLEALAGVVRVLDEEQDPEEEQDVAVAQIRRPGPLGVECPTCHAPIGRPCKAPNGAKNAKRVHGARRRVATGQPAATETPAEIEHRRAAALAYLEARETA
ncbi:hypothetical protein EYS09_08630 [Streptomyces kasugaensis]|uniref:DNA-binding phage zinc finger domain-containing protein n=1 Tax=Streptomyces kasugaensis TaxID=1946 RepID=A0A4Q9HYC9_STRKA|nr:hypothetical protein [Streptomyces kasugaensis]TBO60045.1 hypothetical protein EYS09_08630 [Streptomyces kasugaensis]